MLLQTRGQVTAAEVADELEVSERTARRDLEALGMAGVPVYSRQGRNGGWQLVGGARTDLSGLNAAEARALFLVAGPSSSATPEVKAALRKLVRALPETFRVGRRGRVRPRSSSTRPLGHAAQRPPGAAVPRRAAARVIEGEQVRSATSARDRRPASGRVVHPLGLAAKGPVWYLVADTEAGLRTFRVDRVTDRRADRRAASCGPRASTWPRPGSMITDRGRRAAARCVAGPEAVAGPTSSRSCG